MTTTMADRVPLKAPVPLKRRNVLFSGLLLASMIASVAVLVTLLVDLIIDGTTMLSTHLITDYASSDPAKAGARAALLGTVWLMGLTTLFTVPLGVGAAVYLEEFAPQNRFSRAVETNIANLAGVPSIVYGLLGLGVFVNALRLGTILLSGALTLSLLVLPIVIIATREALRAVPSGIREGAFALGATRWEVVANQVIPAAVPGMMTGTILAMSRAIGETAPLILISGVVYLRFDPTPFSDFTAMPLQIMSWIFRPQADFARLAAAGSLLFLAGLLSMNAVAIVLRNRYRREW